MRITVCLRVGISALIAFCSSAASAVCQDENPDCINWAAAGECDRNMAYMHVSCKKSCGKCSSSAKGEKPAGGQRTAGESSAPKAEDILGDGAYSLHAGHLGGGGEPLHRGRFTLQAAKQWCDERRAECAGFEVWVSKPTPIPAGEHMMVFRRVASTVVDDLNWVSFVRLGDSGASAGTGQCDGGDCASSTQKWHASETARYYLRVAELAAAKGPASSQEVIDQVRAALLSGASREECYLLRAKAYLQQENLEKCKADLGAILRNEPEHTAAKALHRKVKKYQRAIEEAKTLEAGRQYQPAVDKLRAALETFSPPIESSALKQGLCRCQLRLKQSAEAASWCEKANRAEPDDLAVLFALADAKALNGEEHAALQLLKTAQHRFRNNMELHQKAQQLENRIKQQSKVNYYKVLSLTRSASQKEVKRAYHKLAMKYHPDKVAADDKATAEAMFKKIARAYEVLGDEEMRRRYDNGEDVDDANAMNQRQQQQHNPFGGFPGGFSGGGARHHFRQGGFW